MFLLLTKDGKPIGGFDKIQSICDQVEERILEDYTAFQKTDMFNIQQFDLDMYLGLPIMVMEKETIAWVMLDALIYDELCVYDFLNTENSSIIKEIEEYNESIIYRF